MRELRLHLPKPLLGADALRDVDRGDQAYFEIIDWTDAGRGEENVDDAAVPRHHLGFFLEVRFTAKAGLMARRNVSGRAFQVSDMERPT